MAVRKRVVASNSLSAKRYGLKEHVIEALLMGAFFVSGREVWR